MNLPTNPADVEAAPALCVAAVYHFTRFDDPAALRAPLLGICTAGGVKGTILLAPEGFNGTIAGSAAAVAAVLAHLRALAGGAPLEVKYASASAPPFLRMKVRIKREIVTLGVASVDPVRRAGHYVAPADWNALIDDPATIVIDTRNDYEVRIGSFAGAINPQTASFSDFPAWFDAFAARFADAPQPPRIAMFCTGGIRCEKSTALLRTRGFDDVHHLQGGILRYLETMPAADSRWSGECFVFDARVAVGHALAPGTHGLCHACRMPVSAADRAAPQFVEGVSCPHCHGARTPEQRAGYGERERQVARAAELGIAHLGDRDG
ncbi:MAG: rhodanese-related sulfurtransferase [Polymorphobacter sp.]